MNKCKTDTCHNMVYKSGFCKECYEKNLNALLRENSHLYNQARQNEKAICKLIRGNSERD